MDSLRIYTKSGDLAFSVFSFPDSCPHFKLETYEREFDEVTIEIAIKSPNDLFLVLIVNNVLRSAGYKNITLDIRYLMGARMDRAIDWSQPFTLQVIAGLINGAGFSRVRMLDVHSETATRLIRNSINVLPYDVVAQVVATLGIPIIVCPDKGAVERVDKLTPMIDRLYCRKERDPKTGDLSGFTITDTFYLRSARRTKDVLIVDDICDGGNTFIGLSRELRRAGATKIYLFITHAIMSKGLVLEGIDKIYTTDSFPRQLQEENPNFVVIPISMQSL